MPANDLQNVDEIDKLKDTTIALDFWADWAKPCAQMNTLFDQFADTYPNLKFIKARF